MKYFATVLFVVLLTSMALGYTGATVSAMDVQPSDVPGPQPITVFPVPAAAAMTGAQLIYDNSALLPFSTGSATYADRYWVTMPLTAPGITINSLTYLSDPCRVTGVNNTFSPTYSGLHTNMEGTPMDNRYPTHIPRVGRMAWNYTAVQYVLDQPATTFGVYMARHTNFPYSHGDDNNATTNSGFNVQVFVLGESDTFATAQSVKVYAKNMYAPFLKVVSNGTDPIKSVCVVQDAAYNDGAPYGFFDVYAIFPAQPLVGDINKDGYVNVGDLQALAAAWGSQETPPSANWNVDADVNADDYVNVGDLQLLVAHWGEHR